jgi:Glycogen recognition site of AMP-activated protein kinase
VVEIMNDRIQRALDGDLPVDQLTPDERTVLRIYRATICRALAPIQQLESVDVAPEVLRRVAPGPIRRTLGAVIDWIWSPRTFSLSVRPAFAMAGAVAAAAVVSISALEPAPAAGPYPARMLVQFRLGDPEARDVALVGDFNGWRPEHRLHQISAGVWSVDVALEPGVYSYVFVIDGETLRLDPLAPEVTDGFGGTSSRVAVLTPEVRS